MELKVTTLIENIQDNEGNLKFEHGLSLLVEYKKKKILFDTGQTGAFLDNAFSLGFTAEDPDCMVLSHGHYDHSGGVKRFLNDRKKGICVYAGKGYFLPKYKILPDGSYKFNGNSFTKREFSNAKFHEVDDNVTDLGNGLFIFKNFEKFTDYEKVNPRFFIKEGENYRQDFFEDEVALGMETRKGLVVIVGCSHPGIVNMLKSISKWMNQSIYAVIGGTHLVEADDDRIEKTIRDMKSLGVEYVAVSHCTGEHGMKKMEEEFDTHFVKNNTGNVLILD